MNECLQVGHSRTSSSRHRDRFPRETSSSQKPSTAFPRSCSARVRSGPLRATQATVSTPPQATLFPPRPPSNLAVMRLPGLEGHAAAAVFRRRTPSSAMSERLDPLRGTRRDHSSMAKQRASSRLLHRSSGSGSCPASPRVRHASSSHGRSPAHDVPHHFTPDVAPSRVAAAAPRPGCPPQAEPRQYERPTDTYLSDAPLRRTTSTPVSRFPFGCISTSPRRSGLSAPDD